MVITAEEREREYADLCDRIKQELDKKYPEVSHKPTIAWKERKVPSGRVSAQPTTPVAK